MEHETRTIDASDGIPLYVQSWRPEGPARFVVACVHGGGEHGGRYAALAEAWAAKGGLTIALDHRGHGRSGGQRGHVDRFETYAADLRAVLLAEAAELPKEQRPESIPWFLFGHSMGSLVCFIYLLDHERDIPLAGAVLSAPLLRLAMRVHPAKVVAGKLAGFVLPRLPVPSNIPLEALSRDTDEVERYRADPLRVDVVTAAWFNAMTAASARVQREVEHISTPLLVYHGTGDGVCEFGACETLCRKLSGRPNQTFERWEGYFHELHNEPEALRRPVLERVDAWIEERIANERSS